MFYVDQRHWGSKYITKYSWKNADIRNTTTPQCWRPLYCTPLSDGLLHVAHGPHVHGHVPRGPEHGYVGRVPPVAVELSVGEVEQLAHQVQEGMEAQVEEAQPYQVVGHL